MKTTPYAHQAKEFLLSKDSVYRALLWQMRSGKTKEIIDQAHYLFCENKIDGVIVIAPNGVHDNWIRREMPVHAWDCVRRNCFVYNQKLTNRKWFQQAFKDCLDNKLGLEMGWLSINVEAVQFDTCKKHIMQWMKQYPRFMIVFDESHKFGTPGAKRTQRVRGLAKRATYRRILTGSMMDNSPLKAFSQCELLEKGLLGYQHFEDFKDRYAEYETGYSGRRTYPKLKGYKNLAELRAKLAKFCSLVRRCDCEDLPELIRAPVYLEMTPKQVEAYREAIEELMVTYDSVEDLAVEILEGAAMTMKLRQIASGFIIDEEKNVHKLVEDKDNPKIQALLDILEGTDEKVIIWCNFTHDIETLYRVLSKAGYNPVKYHGASKDAERVAAVDRFQNDGSVRVFIGQPFSAGEGLNLGAAAGMVWYSHTYDAEVRNQASERATLVGGNSIWVSDFVFDGLIETRILEVIDAKAEITEFVVGQQLKDLIDALDQAL